MESPTPSGGIRRRVGGDVGTETPRSYDPRLERFRQAKKTFSHLGDDGDFEEREKMTSVLSKVGRFFSEKLSGIKAFGINLGTGGFGMGSKIVDYMWHHKGEIAAGVAGGALGKTATRILIAGSGGWFATGVVGLAGGAAGAGFKEYVRKRGDIPIEEAGNKLIIDGIRNEWRRLGRSDWESIGKASLRGAAFGLAGAVLSDVVADNEWVQQQFAKIHLPSTGISKPAVPAETTPKPAQTAVSTAEVTATPEFVHTGVSSATEVTGGPSGPQTSVPETLPVKPLVPPAEVLPQASDTLTIPQGSSVWTETKTYLEQNLGRPPTSVELNNAVGKIMEDNRITDAGKVPAGASLNISSIQIEISPELAKMPEVIPLPPGSNPWVEVSKYGASYLDRPLTDQETMLITRELARQSGIAVPVWDLKEGLDHTKLPVGFKLIFNSPVKKLLEEMKK